MLARQEYSEKNLRLKLLSKKFAETEIDAAIEKLKQKKYLNDAEICANQFENLYAAENLSVQQICAKLFQRGFDSELIQNQIPEDTSEHELNTARKFLGRKFSGKILDAKIKLKMQQYLASKGFDFEIIRAAVENFSDGDRD